MTFSTPVDFNGREQHPLSAVFWTLADFSSRGRMYYWVSNVDLREKNAEDDKVSDIVGVFAFVINFLAKLYLYV